MSKSKAMKRRSVAAVRSSEWFGIMGDGTKAPTNEDYQRLDFLSRHPAKVKNLKAGCRATDVPHYWQPGLRPAIDAAMETMRRALRAKGGNPMW